TDLMMKLSTFPKDLKDVLMSSMISKERRRWRFRMELFSIGSIEKGWCLPLHLKTLAGRAETIPGCIRRAICMLMSKARKQVRFQIVRLDLFHWEAMLLMVALRLRVYPFP